MTQYGSRIERLGSGLALAEVVADLVAVAVTDGLRQHRHASLVFSGGGTPAIYLPRVALLTLPWDRVRVLLSDERWVGEDSPYSNTAMLRRLLLSRPGPAQADFIAFKNAALTASDGLSTARAGLPPLAEPHRLVLLGMGNDGHIASLFPGTPRLAELLAPENTERIVAVSAPAAASPHLERISLTLAEIMRSERVVLVLQGAAKLQVLERAWTSADPLRTPVVALGDVEVLWSP